MENLELIKLAKKAMGFSYSPYSKFQVGACLLTEKGHYYLGCNIENASYGACNCAERTAIFKAISEGERDFKKIVVVGSNGQFTPPCGICLQVLSEFMLDGIVVLANDKNEIREYLVKELLPVSFHL